MKNEPATNNGGHEVYGRKKKEAAAGEGEQSVKTP